MTTAIEQTEQTRRELVSAVKRLRVLATSDPSRGDDLADALVSLTSARLALWDFSEAAADAPEAVLLAARILARNGASGPYTSPTDASRFFTASALLAAVQSCLGQQEAAARTLAGVDGWLEQLGRLPLREHLPASAVIWSLVARSRSLLATDVAQANACADAAAQRLYAEGLDAGSDHLALTVHLLLADCRWAAGAPDRALAHHRLALGAYRHALGAAAARLRSGVAQAAAAPVVALHEPYAQRLELRGEPELAIAVRRSGVARLEELGAVAGVTAGARAALSAALARSGRGEEADAERAEAAALDEGSREPVAAMAAPGEPRTWSELPASRTLAPATLADAGARLQQDVQAAVFEGVAARLEAQRTEAGLRAAAERAAAERAAEREQEQEEARAASEAARAAARDLEQRESAQAAARREAEEAAARAAAEERRRQLAEEHRQRLAVDPDRAAAAASELDAARTRVRAAGEDLRALRDANERLAELLRPLAAVDPEEHTAELSAALEALVGLRWRLGDTDGSKEAAREAKGLTGLGH